MDGFRPKVAILPAHTEMVTQRQLADYAVAFDNVHADTFMPKLPEGLVEDYAGWGSAEFFLKDKDLELLNALHTEMRGAHALLVVNTATEINRFDGVGTIDHSVSYLMAAAASGVVHGGVPVALTHEATWNGKDDYYHTLRGRMRTIRGLGGTVVGADLNGMPDFLTRRVHSARVVEGDTRPPFTPITTGIGAMYDT